MSPPFSLPDLSTAAGSPGMPPLPGQADASDVARFSAAMTEGRAAAPAIDMPPAPLPQPASGEPAMPEPASLLSRVPARAAPASACESAPAVAAAETAGQEMDIPRSANPEPSGTAFSAPLAADTAPSATARGGPDAAAPREAAAAATTEIPAVPSPVDLQKLQARRRALGLAPQVRSAAPPAALAGATMPGPVPGVPAKGADGVLSPSSPGTAFDPASPVAVQHREVRRVEANREETVRSVEVVLDRIAADNTPESLPLEVLKSV